MSTYGSLPLNSWNAKIYVFGAGLGDPTQTATTILYGLWLFCFVALAIWTAFAGNKALRNGLKLYVTWTVVCLSMIYYTFVFANNIVEDHGAEITAAYLLVNLIFGNDLHFLIDTCLLIAVIYLIFHLSQQYDISGITTRRAFLWTNYFLCFVLATLYLTRTGLDIRSLWYQVFDPEKLVAQIGSGLTIPIVDILDITFDAICLLISAEILGGALWIFMTRKQRNIPTSIASILLLLIALPLFVRSALILGEETTFEIPQANFNLFNPEALVIAQVIIYGLDLLLIMIGIISISIRLPPLSDSRSVRSFDIESMHGTPEESSNTTSNALLEANSLRYSAHPKVTLKEPLRSDLYHEGKMTRLRKGRWPFGKMGPGSGGLGMLNF